MKISKLGCLTKKRGKAVLYNTGENEQWFSCGEAAYPLYGMPRLDEETLPVALSLSEKEQDKTYCAIEEKPEWLDLNEYMSTDIPLKASVAEIEDSGNYIQAYDVQYPTGEKKVFFINKMFLKPFEDYKDYTLLYRETSGVGYVVGMDGLTIIGAIMLYRPDQTALSITIAALCSYIENDG